MNHVLTIALGVLIGQWAWSTTQSLAELIHAVLDYWRLPKSERQKWEQGFNSRRELDDALDQADAYLRGHGL